MKKIRVAIAGVGNYASLLVHGLEYYKGRYERAFFEIDRRKVFARTDLGGGGLDV